MLFRSYGEENVLNEVSFTAKTGQITALVGPSGSETNASTVDRKSTRLNSSHPVISYAVFCLKKKINANNSAALTGFFFNDTATTEIYTLSLHDALPI